MSETQQDSAGLQAVASDAEPVKPSLSFESITFSNGDTLKFEEDEIVVLIGPNNAGKSAALKEMQQFVSKHVAQNVIKNATLRRRGDHTELKNYLEKYASKVGGVVDYRYAGLGYNIHPSHVSYFDNAEDRQFS